MLPLALGYQQPRHHGDATCERHGGVSLQLPWLPRAHATLTDGGPRPTCRYQSRRRSALPLDSAALILTHCQAQHCAELSTRCWDGARSPSCDWQMAIGSACHSASASRAPGAGEKQPDLRCSGAIEVGSVATTPVLQRGLRALRRSDTTVMAATEPCHRQQPRESSSHALRRMGNKQGQQPL